jgi:similar to stage IV sporulation protein
VILDRIRAYLSGSVVLKVRGTDLEKLLNLAGRAGVVLKSVRRHGRYLLTARTSAVDCHRLRGLASTSQYKIEVLGKHGFPLLIHRIRRRRMLLIGLIASVGLIYYMSSFVWFIRIAGISALSEDSIRQYVSSQGIRTGMRRSDLDLEALERDLAIEFPRISWVAVRLRGTLLSIEIAEKLSPDASAARALDVVAGKSGLIVKFIPLAGKPLVEEGHTVEAGQVLVEAVRGVGGSEAVPDGIGPARTEELISARAIVEARVWYQESAQVSLQDQEIVRTGRQKTIRYLHFLAWRIPIGRLGAGFDRFECEERLEVVPLWPGSRIGLSTTVKTCHEVVAYPIVRTAEQARSEALRLARASALASVPEGVEVVDEMARVSEVGEGEHAEVLVEYTVETIEEIGLEQPTRVDNGQASGA